MALKGKRNGPDGLIREGMLDRDLRRLVRPRVESPLAKPEVTSQGDMELRFEPLRVKYAKFWQAPEWLEIYLVGGRIALPTGGHDVYTLPRFFSVPDPSTTYWYYLDSDGDSGLSTSQPPAGSLELATITTAATLPVYPAPFNDKGFVNTFGDLQHGVKNQAVGDSYVVLSSRTQYIWSGTAWEVLLTVEDKRPWFSIQETASPGTSTTPYYARVNRTSNQTITNSVYTAVIFNTEDWDEPGGMVDLATFSTRVTITEAGMYGVTAQVAWGFESSAGDRILRLRRFDSASSTTVTETEIKTLPSSGVHMTALSAYVLCSAGDYLTLEAYQDSGTTMTLRYGTASGWNQYPHLTVVRIVGGSASASVMDAVLVPWTETEDGGTSSTFDAEATAT